MFDFSKIQQRNQSLVNDLSSLNTETEKFVGTGYSESYLPEDVYDFSGDPETKDAELDQQYADKSQDSLLRRFSLGADISSGLGF